MLLFMTIIRDGDYVFVKYYPTDLFICRTVFFFSKMCNHFNIPQYCITCSCIKALSKSFFEHFFSPWVNGKHIGLESR